MTTPIQNLVDVADEAATLISNHIKAKTNELSEEQLIPWSLAFSQLQEATRLLRDSMKQGATALAIGGPLNGVKLAIQGNRLVSAAGETDQVGRYKRCLLRSACGAEMDIAAFMG